MARRKAPVIPGELLGQLLAGRDPQSALGRDGLVDKLKRVLAERALNAEMVAARVHKHADGSLALFHDPRLIAGYQPDGSLAATDHAVRPAA